MQVICPDCMGELTYAAVENGSSWTCAKCGGRTMTMAAVRKLFGEECAGFLWSRAGEAGGTRRRPCPICSGYLTEVHLPEGKGPPMLDVCASCRCVWAGPAAGKASPVAMPAPAVKPSPPLAIPDHEERLARVYAEMTAARMNDKYPVGLPWWKYLLGWLGMPVKFEETGLTVVPWVTWSLALVITFISLNVLRSPDFIGIIRRYGFIPNDALRCGGLTFITSFILHGSMMHLIGNMYFLIAFGVNIEERLGKGFYLLLILTAVFAGNALHVAFDPLSKIPLIGASGGIAALLIFYCFTFTRTKLGFLLFMRTWIKIPAWVYALFWVLLQVLGVRNQASGAKDNTAYLVHLGGVAVGFLAWLVWKLSEEEKAVKDPRLPNSI